MFAAAGRARRRTPPVHLRVVCRAPRGRMISVIGSYDSSCGIVCHEPLHPMLSAADAGRAGVGKFCDAQMHATPKWTIFARMPQGRPHMAGRAEDLQTTGQMDIRQQGRPVTQVPMLDLKRQHARIKASLDAAIAEVMDSCRFINGPQVKLFTSRLAEYAGAKHAIGTANGTDALQIALMSLNLNPGDEVIVPAFTYVASAEVIALLHLVPVMVDPSLSILDILHPRVLVDATIAKRNLGTRMDMAPLVIALGPGFTAGVDCHAVIETKRGHTLGRVIYHGTAIPNSGVPGNIAGYAEERVIHSPSAGIFRGVKAIGDIVRKGDVIAYAGDVPVHATIDGKLRGLLHDGLEVPEGFKIADIDPRGEKADHTTISDKARAIAGGVLEAADRFVRLNEIK